MLFTFKNSLLKTSITIDTADTIAAAILVFFISLNISIIV